MAVVVGIDVLVLLKLVGVRMLLAPLLVHVLLLLLLLLVLLVVVLLLQTMMMLLLRGLLTLIPMVPQIPMSTLQIGRPLC